MSEETKEPVLDTEPEAKKQKIEEATTTTTTTTTTTMSAAAATDDNKPPIVPEAPDSEWPEAWYMMEDGTYEDQKERNRLTPNKPVSVADLRELGIAYWKMDAVKYTYPAKAIPWDPKDATDPKLKAIRDFREYHRTELY